MEIPEKVYIQTCDELGNEMDMILDEVTWCVDQINDTDPEYILADKYRALEEINALLLALFQEWMDTPFLEDAEEWEEWVSKFGPRVDAAVADAERWDK